MPQFDKERREAIFISNFRLGASIWILVALLAFPALAADEDPKLSEKQAEPTEQAEQANATGESADDALPAGHSQHGEAFNEGPRQAAYLMDGTGPIEFPVSSDVADVQAFVEQGIGQLHGFWYFEAERSFRQAATLDPNCAIAYWGMALANANNSTRAKAFIEKAVERKANAAPHEQMFIDAYNDYLNGEKKRNDRTKTYVKALEQIVRKFPEQLEYKAQLGYALYKYRSTLKKDYDEVDSFLNEILAEQPLHPVHHYRIHLWDYKDAAKALNSAARCGASAPAIAHMWHMPGHIYSRLKRYHDAVWQQEASARVDHAQMIRNQILPDQIHNFAHNNEWLIRNLIHIGRHRDAADLARNMIELPRHPKYNTLSRRGSSYYGRMRLFDVLDKFEQWEQLAALADTPYLEPTDKDDEQVKRYRYVGIAQANLGNFEQAEAALEEIEQRLKQARDKADQERMKEEADDAAEEKKDEQKRREIMERARAAVEMPPAPEVEMPPAPATGEPMLSDAGKKELEEEKKKAASRRKSRQNARKSAERRRKQAVEKLEKAAAAVRGHLAMARGEFEAAAQQFSKSDEDDLVRARALAASGQADEAIKLARKAVDSNTNEVRPLAVLVDVLSSAGKTDEAGKAFEQLRQISSDIQFESPLFERLQPVASELDLPPDWRVTREVPEDFGPRPSLDSLGPFRWSPFGAEPWTLHDHTGSEYSLASLQGRENGQGRPIVVIFYLGYGCLHCAEQLHAFAPRAEDFEKAGIDLVAISSDNQEGLKKSLENYTGGDMPFPLLADANLDVFKAYRVYDDFEKMPLHGTFLIDGEGQVRWQDISYEPFMDVDFVLEESQRLLGQSAVGR